ncbi:hypothetical protein B0X71_11215 [Planococcus lenghuensis]|uniref:RCK N-terminal domain-containing protein n=2 Tax=Planococcus lenghuensis TaxID=2213202 RepID=A0A1Q2L3U6_9BACL|nr:hypothetical protein B0X71_11215 [Planococcus lenghuensis]
MKKAVQISTVKLIGFTAAFYVISAFIIYLIEPQTFHNPFIGFWWVMTTVTTIGFGDYAPVTVPGMVFAMFLYLSGIGLIGVIIGKVVDLYALYGRMRMEGKFDYKGKNHFVIIGWSQKALKTAEEILSSHGSQKEVVLIDNLPNSPYSHDRFHYIRGNPTENGILKKAGVTKANSVSVFATADQDEVLADGKTLLIVSAIEKYAVEQNVQIYTIVEIVHEKHIGMFEHARVDEFVLSNEAFPHLMAKTILHHGSSQLFMQLLSHRYGENIWEISPAASWETYEDAFEALKAQGANLVADGADFSIFRRLHDRIPDSARLYIICDQETYKNLTIK